MSDHGFKLVPGNDLVLIRSALGTKESIDALDRLEFELAAWRLGRTILLERLCQINEGEIVNGELYIKFSTACKVLGEV